MKFFNKIFFFIAFALAPFLSCTGRTEPITSSTNPGETTTTLSDVTSTTVSTATAISPVNFTSYSVDLDAYGYEIYYVSNFSGTVESGTEWWKDAVVYQAFPRAFYDSNGDGQGDLDGMTAKMDYIGELGCTAVWTLPIFESPSEHGYDATDYYAIEGDYGTSTDFDEYVTAAHGDNIKVILDLVLNHSSDSHPWFTGSAAQDGTHDDWYCWTNSAVDWPAPWSTSGSGGVWSYNGTRGAYYYGAFWSGMPDLNYNNAAVRAEVTNIAKYWIDRGVDGYRLDAVRYLVETGPNTGTNLGQADTTNTIDVLTYFEAACNSFDSEFYTVGEAWTDNYADMVPYCNNDDGLDSVFSFHFLYAMKSAFVNQSATSVYDFIAYANSSITVPWTFFATFLDNHDNPLGGDLRWADFCENEDAIKASAAIQMTFPGTPYIYYGTEIGMPASANSGDKAKRSPMHWDDSTYGGFTSRTGGPTYFSDETILLADNSDPCNVEAQVNNADSILSHYKRLIALRKEQSALSRGEISLVDTGDSGVLAYLREGESGAILVVVNVSNTSVSTTLDFSPTGLSSSSTYPMTMILNDEAPTNSGGGSTTTTTTTTIPSPAPTDSLSDGTLLIIIEDWFSPMTVYTPGDYDWDPVNNEFAVSSLPATNEILNAVTTANLLNGGNANALELKIVEDTNWAVQWVFSGWSLYGATVTDGNRQINIPCDDNDVVVIEIDKVSEIMNVTVAPR